MLSSGVIAVPALAEAPAAVAAHPAHRDPAGLAKTSSRLTAGHSLSAGQKRVSPNGQYKLVMQGDGNLVEYMQGHPLWASGTSGNPGARAVMQTDGNLVVYLGSAVLWQAGSGGHPAAAYYLAVQSDANLVIYTPSNTAIWSSGTVSDTLWAGTTLTAGQYLHSPNGQYELSMQTDGNLVEYMQGHPLWQSSTSGNPGARVVMQTDGNLVVYLGSAVLWQAGSGGHPAAAYYLAVQSDANLVIYTPAGVSLWASYTVSDTLWAGTTLTAGQYLHSPNGSYELSMQTDGNLVVYSGGAAIWQSHTSGNPGARAVMQTDGNLVVYLGSAVLWQSGSGGHPAAAFYLVMQSDGNLVIYTPAGVALWWSQTRHTGGACNAFGGAYQLPGSNGVVPAAYSDSTLVVPACGPIPGTGGGPNVYPYPGSLATPGYQCVEFSERYLYYKYGVTMGISTNGDQVAAHYAAKYPSLFSLIGNGAANQAPGQGDVLSFSTVPGFDSGSGGHTAVVQSSSVNSAGNGSLTVVEENAASTGVAVLTVSGWNVSYPGYPYVEWIHAH